MRLFFMGFLGLVACGTEPNAGKDNAPETGKETTPEDKTAQESFAKYHSMLVATTVDLPTCTPESEGWLVYVKSESTFKYCASGAWENIDIKGPKGDKGEPGAVMTATAAATATATSTGDGTKLRKGMTKAEVEAAVGAPKSVESYSSFTVWRLDASKCGQMTCSIQFTAEGILDKVSDVKPELIDLATF